MISSEIMRLTVILMAMLFSLAFGENGEEYCESEKMLTDEAGCKASSCCHWNDWEEGEASNNGAGRCWSSIGKKTCDDTSDSASSRCVNDEEEEWPGRDGHEHCIRACCSGRCKHVYGKKNPGKFVSVCVVEHDI